MSLANRVADHFREPDHWQAALRGIALLCALASSALVPILGWSSPDKAGVWTVGAFAVLSWVTWAMTRTRFARLIGHLFIYSSLVVCTLGVIAGGSVRSSAIFIFAGSVAAAGSFLGYRALAGVLAYTVVALGLLVWAESAGLMQRSDFGVGLNVWVTQATTLVVIGIVVFYSRSSAHRAHQRQLDELLKREASERERDAALARFEHIFRSSPSPMLAQSALDGSIVDVNPAFELAYGHTRQALLGRPDTDLWVQPEDRKAYARELLKQRQVIRFKTLLRRADRSTFEAELSSQVDDGLEDKLVISTITDISAQEAALDKLRRSEERFAKAFQLNPLHMTITRLSDGQLLDANQVARGAQPAGIGTEPGPDLSRWPVESMRAEFLDRLKQDGQLMGYETQMRGNAGTVVDVKIWAEPIELDGAPCVLAATLNVTEEKRRQELVLSIARGMSPAPGASPFQTLVEHMSEALGADAVLVASIGPDLDMQTLAVWRDGQAMPNFEQRLDALPALPGDAWAPADARATASVWGGLSTPSSAPSYPLRCDWPLFDENGRAIGLLSAQWQQPMPITPQTRALVAIFSSRAISELQRHMREVDIQRLNTTLEDRVRIRTEELEQVNAELDSFAYSVSHDLKSPLRAIDGYTHILLERLADRADARERDMMQRVLSATHRMSDLIRDLLALARVSQRDIQLSQVDLSEMARSVLAQLLPQFANHPGDVRIADNLSCICDPVLTRIALTNLFHNALKFTRDQPSPRIEFGCQHDTGKPELFIQDNGAGFNMKQVGKLFKPFQRLHTHMEFEGTGIGLATTRRIVERHGGSIRAEASIGRGARFIFTMQADNGVAASGSRRTKQ